MPATPGGCALDIGHTAFVELVDGDRSGYATVQLIVSSNHSVDATVDIELGIEQRYVCDA